MIVLIVSSPYFLLQLFLICIFYYTKGWINFKSEYPFLWNKFRGILINLQTNVVYKYISKSGKGFF